MKTKRSFAFCAGAFVAAGCSGGGEGTFRRFIPGPPLEIVSRSPIESATGVEFDEVVSVTFDSPINPGTVDSTTLAVSLDASPVDGSFAVDQAVVTFVPASPFPPLANLAVTISTGLSSTGGSVLSSAEVWDFSTRDFAWGVPVLVETSSSSAAWARVSANQSGEAIAVWQQGETPTAIWSSRFTAASGWGVPQQVESDPSDDASYPGVGIDASGAAVSVYWRVIGGVFSLVGARNSGAGWTVALPLESGSLNAGGIDMAVAPTGVAAVAWEQSDGVRSNVWVNRLDPVLGWQGEESPDATDEGAYSPSITVAENGIITVVWEQAGSEVWAARYLPGGGWTPPELIEDDTTMNAAVNQVVSDSNGNAVALLAYETGGIFDLWAVRHVVGFGWVSPEPLEQGSAAVGNYAISMNGEEAVVAYTQRESSTWFVWTTHFRDGVWSVPTKVSMGADGTSGPSVAIDAESNIVCAWYQRIGATNSIWAARRHAGSSSWLPAQLLEQDDVGQAWFPSAALGGNGRAIVAWQQQDGTRENIWSAWLQ